jgi:tetratricopeptide (TPR) repeat protein
MKTSEAILSWYDVSPEVKQLLVAAAQNWENTSESEQYIYQALAKNETNLDVLVAAYRYFFYKNNNAMALNVALKVIEKIKAIEHFPESWEQLKPILQNRREESNIRLYLNAYSASGFVLARLGEREKAQEIASRVKEIDDKNEFGASVIWDILTNPEEEED